MAAGDPVLWSDVLAVAGGLLARGRRVTGKTGIGATEVGVLRVDDIPVVAGRAYQVAVAQLNMITTVANDMGGTRIRVAYSATTGTIATTASGHIIQYRNTIDLAGGSNGQIGPVGNGFYFPTANGFISVLLGAVRLVGTGSMDVPASSVDPLDMCVFDLGTDTGNAGVIL